MGVIGKKVVGPAFVRYTGSGALFSGRAVITFQDGEEDPEDAERHFTFEIPAADVEDKTKAQKLAYVKASFLAQLDSEEARAIGKRAVASMGADALTLPAELP